MKCKHIHKDYPEDAVCRDCKPKKFWALIDGKSTRITMEEANYIYNEVKGGIKHENN